MSSCDEIVAAPVAKPKKSKDGKSKDGKSKRRPPSMPPPSMAPPTMAPPTMAPTGENYERLSSGPKSRIPADFEDKEESKGGELHGVDDDCVVETLETEVASLQEYPVQQPEVWQQQHGYEQHQQLPPHIAQPHAWGSVEPSSKPPGGRLQNRLNDQQSQHQHQYQPPSQQQYHNPYHNPYQYPYQQHFQYRHQHQPQCQPNPYQHYAPGYHAPHPATSVPLQQWQPEVQPQQWTPAGLVPPSGQFVPSSSEPSAPGAPSQQQQQPAVAVAPQPSRQEGKKNRRAPPSTEPPPLNQPVNTSTKGGLFETFETFVDSDLSTPTKAPKPTSSNQEASPGKENPAKNQNCKDAQSPHMKPRESLKPTSAKKASRKTAAVRLGYHKCLVMRDRSGGVKNRLYPTYQLFSQEGPMGAAPQLIMVAQKQRDCRTPHYRFYDMTRTLPGAKLSKKAGNYVGKLRGNFNRDEYSVYSAESEKTTLGCIVYDKCDVIAQLRDGTQPRKMSMLLPAESEAAALAAGASKEDGANSNKKVLSVEERLAKMAAGVGGGERPEVEEAAKTTVKQDKYLHLVSKEPVFEKGNYRLNFHGRVKLPSVKNYQLVPATDISNVWTQFGKVNEDDFHLDFKAPLTPLLAFAAAISQFDY